MDQIISLGVQALKAYKEQLDAAAEKVEIARALVKKIEVFEVTICMIPSRGNAKDVEKLKAESTIKMPEKVTEKAEHAEKTFTAKLCNYCKHVGSFAFDELADQASNAMNDLLDGTLAGAVMSLIPSGSSDEEPIVGKQTPGDILNSMRKRGVKDLDITFVGMGFVIHAAITIVKNSISIARQIQIPNIFWIVMPWKVMKQNKIGEQLITFMDAIDKYNSQLQVSISVASYAVNLEQLENALNATSMLVSEEMKIFWRRKVGISHTSISMVELAASFMDELQDRIKAYKSQNSHIIETVSEKKIGEVMLRRIFTLMWNPNGDEVCTVYEVNEATKRFGPTADSITLTFGYMKSLEMDFYKQIAFYPLGPKNPSNHGSKDDILGDFSKSNLSDDIRQILDGNMHPNDRVVVLEPFQRLTVVASVPTFPIDVFPYDYIALMKYNKVKNLKDLINRKKNISLTEIDEARTYLKMRTNDDFFGKDVYKWNAPKTFVDFNGEPHKNKAIPYIKSWKEKGNFEEVDFSTKPDDQEEEEDDDDENQGKEEIMFDELNDIGVTKKINLLYAPLMVKPGVYTVRLALDSLELNASDTTRGADHSKKIALSEKGYYYNRSLKVDYEVSGDALETIDSNIVGTKIFMEHFSPAYKQFLDISESEAIISRDFKKFKKVQNSQKSLRLKDDNAEKAAKDAGVKTAATTVEEKSDAVEQSTNKQPEGPKRTEKRKSQVDQIGYQTNPLHAENGANPVPMVPLSKEISAKLLADVNRKNKAELEKLKTDTEKLTTAIKAHKNVNAEMIKYLDYLQVVLKYGENDKPVSEEVSFMQKNSSADGDVTGAVTIATERLRDLQKLAQSKDLELLNNSSASISVRLKSIQMVNTILKRFRLSFDVAVLIHELGIFLDKKLKGWLEDLSSGKNLSTPSSSSTSSNAPGVSTGENTAATSVPSSKEQLRNAENIFRHLLSMKNWYQSLLPADLEYTIQKLAAFAKIVEEKTQKTKKSAAAKNPVSSTPTPGKTEQVLEEKKKRSYLVDLAKDASSLTECLTDDLFKYYCACKIGVLELDAKESIAQRNFRRLESLESNMEKLFEAIVKRYTPNKGEEKENQDIPTSDNPDGPALASDFVKSLKTREVNCEARKTLIVQTTELIACINNYMTDSLMNKKAKEFDIIKGKKCAKVITELEGIKEEAQNLPREDIPTHEEDLLLVQALLPKPLGLVVVVQDVAAMVWAEKVKTGESSSSTGDISEVKWRPMMEGRYPYIRKTTLEIKPSTIRPTHKKEDLTFAVFVNLPNSEEKPSKKEDKGAKTAVKEEPAWSLIVSRNDNPYNSQTFEIARGETLCKLDLSNIYDGPTADDLPAMKADVQHTEENEKSSNDDDDDNGDDDGDDEQVGPTDPLRVQYTVRLVKTGTDTETELGNTLTLTFCEESHEEHDGDEYGGSGTYWDDDDDSDDDDDDDSDEDDDDDDENYEAKAHEAFEVYDKLPDTVTSEIHVHPLEKLCSVYGGMYGCDVCDKTGQDAVYHCEICGFDAHPQCVVDDFNDLHRTFLYGSDDGDNDYDYDNDDDNDEDNED